jgi:hypothetical protein
VLALELYLLSYPSCEDRTNQQHRYCKAQRMLLSERVWMPKNSRQGLLSETIYVYSKQHTERTRIGYCVGKLQIDLTLKTMVTVFGG